MPTTINFDLESPDWLRKLRWASIFGMLAAVLGSWYLGAEFSLSSLFQILIGLSVWNLLLPFIENRLFTSSKGFLFLQVLVDIVGLTLILWFSGGLVNPFISFYVLHVLVAGLLLNSLLTLFVSLFSVASVVALLWAPPLVVSGIELVLEESPIWYGIPVGLVLLILITNGFIWIFLGRLGQAQDQLRQKEKMDALGRLVAGLAHEIGTPLNSILILSKDMEIDAPQEMKKSLEIISHQARRCGEIVSLLLGYSRTFVRKGEDVQYTPVKIVPWVEEMYRLLAQGDLQAKAGNEPIFRVTNLDLPEEIPLPGLILRQVLENLLKNARDAIREVPAPKISVTLSHDLDEGISVLVEDNGPGFSKEERQRAFEAFFSTKKQGLGNGLGLYISYYLLSQVGGRIVIEDHSGVGAKIRVNLPRWEDIEQKASFVR